MSAPVGPPGPPTPLSICNPIYLRSMAQGTPELLPPASLRWAASPFGEQPLPVHHCPALLCFTAEDESPGPWSLPPSGPQPGCSGFSSSALGLSAPPCRQDAEREINSLSGELMCAHHKAENQQQRTCGRWMWLGTAERFVLSCFVLFF